MVNAQVVINMQLVINVQLAVNAQLAVPCCSMRQFAAPWSRPWATARGARIAHLAAKCCQMLQKCW